MTENFTLIYPNDQSLNKLLETVRSEGKSIAFTNGCFDLLHGGHAHYLQQAKQYADLLIVALNSDESVRKLNKGPMRPIVPLVDRAYLVSQLKPVDIVLSFNQDTPRELLKIIKPDVLIKGGDYASKEEIVGYDIVEEYGGKALLIKTSEQFAQHSTTNTINKIQKILKYQ